MYPLAKKIIIADDHPLIRKGLKMLLENEFNFHNISEAESYQDLSTQLASGDFTHLILDLNFTDTNVLEKFATLHTEHPELAILIYSMYPTDVYGPHLVQLGARGYLNKQSSDEDVVKCLNAFFLGRKCLGNTTDLSSSASVSTSHQNPFASLSHRELQVLPYIIHGSSTKEIAATLRLKPNTVTTFKSRIFDKLKVKNVYELNQLANLYQYSA